MDTTQLTLNKNQLLRHLKILLHLNNEDLHWSQKYPLLLEEVDKLSTCKKTNIK